MSLEIILEIIYIILLIIKIYQIVSGVVTHYYYPSSQEAEEDDCEFKISLYYITKLCLKRTKQTNILKDWFKSAFSKQQWQPICGL
jgi:hypothetical protein